MHIKAKFQVTEPTEITLHINGNAWEGSTQTTDENGEVEWIDTPGGDNLTFRNDAPPFYYVISDSPLVSATE